MIKAMITQPHSRNNEFSILRNITIVNDNCLETIQTGAHRISNQSHVLIYMHQFYKMGNMFTVAESLPRHRSHDPISATARGARALVTSAWAMGEPPRRVDLERRCGRSPTYSVGRHLNSSSTTAVSGRELELGNHGPWCLKCRWRCPDWIGLRPWCRRWHPGSTVVPRLNPSGGQGARGPLAELAGHYRSSSSSSSSTNKQSKKGTPCRHRPYVITELFRRWGSGDDKAGEGRRD
jgi:hypothetical protein